MAGEVIGVNTLVMITGKGIGFSIPSKYVMELVNLPNQQRHAYRGWLGVYVSDMTSPQAKALGMSEPRGTFVDEVLQSSPAYKAGLRVRDLILDAGGEQIRNGRHLARIVASSKPGDRIRMNIIRAGKPHSLKVIIGKAPQ
jgi:serine protease Do